MFLNKKQSLAFSLFKQNYNIFITGGAGTGKSFITKYLKDHVNTGSLAITSTTGISALNIGGITLHSWGGIGYDTDTNDISGFVRNIQNNYIKLNNYLYTKFLIIDEVSMLDSTILEFLNSVAKKIRENNEPFGGIQLVLIGDFYQLPPVNSSKFAFHANCWNEIVDYTIILKDIYRQEDDMLVNTLNKIRRGKIDDSVVATIEKCSEMIDGETYTHLYPNKSNVHVKNILELGKIQGKILEIKTKIKYKNKSNKLQAYPTHSNIPESILLKTGAFLMLTTNLDIKNGLVNGTQGIFQGFSESNLIFETSGKRNLVPIKSYNFENYCLEQYPVTLAWAITIHKSQGMGIEYLSVDVGDSIFEDGQSYVALSRSRTLLGLHIKNFSKKSIKCNSQVKKFYSNLVADSKIWTEKPSTKTVYTNKLDGRRSYTLPKNAVVVVEPGVVEPEIVESDYSDYTQNCSLCNSAGCRKDYMTWYNEQICTHCIMKDRDYKQLGTTDVHKLLKSCTASYITNILKTIPSKLQVFNTKFRQVKRRLYIIKSLKNIGPGKSHGVVKNVVPKKGGTKGSKKDRIELTQKLLLADHSIDYIMNELCVSGGTVENYIFEIFSGTPIPDTILKKIGIDIDQTIEITKYITKWKLENRDSPYASPMKKTIIGDLGKHITYSNINYAIKKGIIERPI